MLTRFKNRWNSLNKIQRAFVLAAIGGASSCILFLFILRPLTCETASDQWTVDGYKYSTPEYYGTQKYGQAIIQKKKNSYTGNESSENKYEANFYEIICGETKATDIALVFFTYVLALIGWTTMCSAEETAKKIERAYLFVDISGDLMATDRGIMKGIRIANIKMKNLGKTPAILVDFNCLPHIEPGLPTTISKSDRDHIPHGIAIAPGGCFPYEQEIMLTEPELIEVENLSQTLSIAGRMRYLDTFGNRHETLFCWQWYPHTKSWGIANNHELNKYT